MTLVWVVGASGLVGKAVSRAALRRGFDVRSSPVPWTGAADHQREALRAASSLIAADASDEDWYVVWVAGAGVVNTSRQALDIEDYVFGAFLEDLAHLQPGRGAPRAVFFASSAGAVYAGSTAPPFTEYDAVKPLAPYGYQKLAMEARLTQYTRRTGVPAMIGRITNAYGPGQNLAKPQGLISQLGRAYLLRQPISLYVSLDTVRDYIYVDDCGRMIIDALERLARRAPDEQPVVKILGSGVPVTIAMILGDYRHLLRRRPPVVLGDSPSRRYQVRDLRMRSLVWPELNRYAHTTMLAGIGSTMADLRARLRAGAISTATY